MGVVRATPRNLGFSLVELLVVLVILGIVYGLAGPVLDLGGSSVDTKAASRQLAAGLRKARSTAITEGHEAALTLDVEARKFSVTGDPKIYALPGKVNISLFTAQSELVAAASAGIRFFPDGSSTGGRITLSAESGKQSVDVDWVTGRVKIL